MAQLFWFHAFNRHLPAPAPPKTPDEKLIVEVLKNGPKIRLNAANETQQYEKRLKIDPHRVYAYLGRTLDAFGQNAVVLPPEGMAGGDMSPFDTGGLIKKIKPVADLDDTKKCAFLSAFTFDIEKDRTAVLAEYPGQKEEHFAHYLSAKAPENGEGPHYIWPRSGQEHAIWTSNPDRDWRAWTWEGRVEEAQFGIATLRHWTCPTTVYDAVLKEGLKTYGKEFALTLTKSYVEGGVGVMVAQLKDVQIKAA